MKTRSLLYILAFSIASLFTLAAICAFIKLPSDISTLSEFQSQENELISRLKGPVDPTAPDVLAYVKERFLHSPSTLPYNLTPKNEFLEISGDTLSWPFLKEAIQFLFKDEGPGFFVEAGALDGEYESHTLYLEKEKGWRGLLVEPNRFMFSLLKSKNRKAWSTNCCLAVYPYPHESIFHQQSLAKKKYEHNRYYDVLSLRNGLIGTLEESPDSNLYSVGYSHYDVVQCVPLHTLLLAIDITRVHLLVLDVEGTEQAVLDNFPFHKIFVDVWIVEHKLHITRNNSIHTSQNPDSDFVKWQLLKGFVPYSVKMPYVDYIFMNRKSPIHLKAKNKWPRKWRHSLDAVLQEVHKKIS